MTDLLVAFINELDQNPELQEKYKQNPRQVAESFDLPESDIELLLTNDKEAFQKRFEQEGINSIVWIQHSN